MENYTDIMVELMENEMLNPILLAKMCMKYMGEDDVRQMIKANELEAVIGAFHFAKSIDV